MSGSSTVASPPEPLAPIKQDIFLEEIARLANLGIGQWVTLMVSGTTICGRTLSGRDFFSRIADQAASYQFTGKVGDVDFASILSNNYRDYTRLYDKPDGAPEDWAPPKVGYIHLEMAKILLNGSMVPSGDGMLWRGSLSSINGFALSRLELS
ncbi:hypothetical protein ABID82_005656 [Methylobacterium sp. PvP062]|uniref:Gas vesicle protein n=1 Tax=Methylobacterium radiotolerans TaxID=31998 RepID=A0ABV2NPW0_9HYPH|nr:MULTISPECIES: hypothetical protein [unclassified Methylobacterium]MBP2494733.1 hypothetical protein [Methylobacterium sp. PvP105]MBP2505396.1 hypothetical protein [Methylobacterium sp. PvP109]MCX7334683.1 hypothetical protein [Hyphomicrobiales bacterium]